MSTLAIFGMALGAVLVILVLACLSAVLSYGRRFRADLSRHPRFTSASGRAQETRVEAFTYAPTSDLLLKGLREALDLRKIAGNGPEMQQWINLLTWVHNLTTHARNPSRPERMDGLHLAHLAINDGKRFNCWMYATVLNDVLLSLDYASRIVHLWPHRETPGESHLVTAAYSQSMRKWIHLDPDMCAYVMDDQGVPLGIAEIRERLIRRQTLRVSDSIHMAGAGWMGRALLKKLYLWYLAKNIFRFECPVHSAPGYETAPSGRTYIHLIPDGYHDEWLVEPRTTPRGNTIRYVRDPKAFWQAPTPRGEDAI